MIDDVASVALPDRGDAMQRISARLSDADRARMISTGDHATLRRMPLKDKATAVGVTVKLLLEAGVEAYIFESDWEAWKLIAHVAALLSGTGRLRSHSSRRGFGTALHEARLSENRLLRLTAARGEALRDQVALVARFLAHASEKGPVNLWQVLHLIGRNADKAETARLQIALDYYTAVAKAKKGKTQ